jgi:predicted nuclease of predicted toxin-antitoxin system
MRFLADENFPRAAVTAIEAAGHDIVWIRTVAPGISDAKVLARAIRERRILLTFDKDFGELAGRSGRAAESGVILFRLPMTRTGDVGAKLAERVVSREDWAGHFSVIEPGRIRMRRIAA